MDKRTKNRLTVISFLILAGAPTTTLDWSRGLFAQEAPQNEDFIRSRPAPSTAAIKPDLIVTVRAYDYVQVPETLANAEEVTTRIFHEAGIKVEWHDCIPLSRRALMIRLACIRSVERKSY